MFCDNCGKELSEGAICSCRQSAGKDYKSYDYKTVVTTEGGAPQMIDCYEALGWEYTRSSDSITGICVTLNFKRNRKIRNKEQLNRLQARLDDGINSLGVMEREKTRSATILSLAIGIIGSLIFGGGMCFYLVESFYSGLAGYIAGAVLGAVGAAACCMSYPAYRKIRANKTAQIDILIQKKRDEIAQLCEDAQKLVLTV